MIELVLLLVPVLVLHAAAFAFGYVSGVKQQAELAKIDTPDEPLIFSDAEGNPFIGTSVDVEDGEE